MTTTPAIPDVTSTAPDTAGRRFQELGGIDFAVAPAGMLSAAGHVEAARSLLEDHLLG